MKKNLKRNIVMAAVLLFVCAAVYLNWSYNNRQGAADSAMVRAEDEAMTAANEQYLETLAEQERAAEASAPAYFASARLTRQQSRDEALSLLETAAAAETASQEVIDSAMSQITGMANASLLESKIENELLAKDFADCVVYLTDTGCTVAVPAPSEGLSEADVARVTDAVMTNAQLTAAQINVIEVMDY